jgi:hypothetical protein
MHVGMHFIPPYSCSSFSLGCPSFQTGSSAFLGTSYSPKHKDSQTAAAAASDADCRTQSKTKPETPAVYLTEGGFYYTNNLN